MAFPVINYSSPELMKSPVNDIVQNLLSGYRETTQNRYLEPSLKEALQKAQLENKYYAPNIESQIGLRGAQAGHLGALTNKVGIENQFLPQKLKDEAANRAFALNNPLFGYSGAAGQLGALAYIKEHPELFEQSNTNNLQSYIPGFTEANYQNQDQQLSPYDMLKQSIIKSLTPQSSKTSLEKAQDYASQLDSQFGKDSEQAKLAHAYVEKVAHGTQKQKDLALEQHREKLDNRALWNSLPANAKAHAIAIGQGAGFSADETVRHLASGGSMKDLLYQHGITDESQVEPVYQLTTAAQTQLLQRQFASTEADYLSNFIRKNTGEYARTVAGYSPKLIHDQLSGKNEDQQARFLAARGLAPELVNLRLVLANAKSTVHAQKMLSDKAMLEMHNFKSLVSPKIWNKTQKIMDDTLQKMFKQAKTKFGQKANLNQKVSQKVSNNEDNDPLGIR